MKKEMIAMLLAGEQGSRLGVLTSRMAKSAVAFGGKYRIIDFALSNCIHSGVDTVGVLTQYQPLRLNAHIGIGIPWDLDRNVGGVTVLPPYEKSADGVRCTGTAHAVWQNLEYMESCHPDYVLILPGDHVCKMDYGAMLDFHKANGAEVTIAAMPVPVEEAGRFDIVTADENRRVVDLAEKPVRPKSNLASMGIYLFSWQVLRETLAELADRPELDFGRHVIPYCQERGAPLYVYEFNGYWRDVETLNAYWEANRELISLVPEFNLYEEYWKVYTKSEFLPPQYLADTGRAERSIIGEGSEIYGEVYDSVIGCGVTIGEGTVVRDSIVMNRTGIGRDCELNKAIVAEGVRIGDRVRLGVGEEAQNRTAPHIYDHGIVTVGEKSVIPDGVTVGKNTVISGVTVPGDYDDSRLESGGSLVKAGEGK